VNEKQNVFGEKAGSEHGARPVRRKDRQLARDEAEQILTKAEYGVLSVIGDGGAPYGVPLSFVWLEGAVYFHCAKEGHKTDALRRDARVSFAAVCGVDAVYENDFTTAYSSVVVSGVAAEASSEEERRAALTALCVKYLPEHAEKADGAIQAHIGRTAVWKIVPLYITAKGRKKQGV